MQSKDVVRMVFDGADSVLQLLEDMADAPMTFPTANGGNHPMWVLGHLTYIDGWIFWEVMRGEPNPVAEWQDLFTWKTEPSDDASLYPKYEDVLAKYKELRGQISALLDSASEEDLDKESANCPEKSKHKFGTWRHCFLRKGLHALSHKGQVADSRRMLERKPLVT